MRERSILEESFNRIKSLDSDLNENLEIAELGESEGDEDLLEDAVAALKELHKSSQKYKLDALLSGEVDGNDCYVEIHPGAGGTEAQDWAEMVERMYLRWANSRGMKTEIIEEQSGDEAGIKSSTIKIEGDYVFGWLKKESVIHRLVRISPFDSGARRHTSFASVWIYPVVDENINIEIFEKDL